MKPLGAASAPPAPPPGPVPLPLAGRKRERESSVLNSSVTLVSSLAEHSSTFALRRDKEKERDRESNERKS